MLHILAQSIDVVKARATPSTTTKQKIVESCILLQGKNSFGKY